VNQRLITCLSAQITALDFFCQKDHEKMGLILAERLTDHEVCRHSTVRDAKPDRTPGDQKAWTPENELALSGFVSPGGSFDYKCKGQRWMVLNLNRLLGVSYHLPLNYGKFKEKTLPELVKWLQNGYAPPKNAPLLL
jgi:hypothetical protein